MASIVYIYTYIYIYIEVQAALQTLLWMDEILHHLESMGNRCWLAVTGESSFQALQNDAGFRPSTVWPSRSDLLALLPCPQAGVDGQATPISH